MNGLDVLVAGAGIAGPALALSLRGLGCRVTVVERAARLREGGQAVDFRGPVHRAVLERLDLWEAIHARRTAPGPLELVDRRGRVIATLPEAMLSGDVEILRGDLSAILHERSRDSVEYRFGDRIARMRDGGDRVEVELESGAAGTWDLVVGADGLHSRTRRMAIADDPRVVRHHGYRLATFSIPNLLGRDRGGVSYAEPGRAVSVLATSSSDARALLLLAEADRGRVQRTPEEESAELAARFSGMGWRGDEVLAALDGADDLYCDAIATVHVPRYARGRVALLGDAAWGGTLGGQGTSLAIVGAYVLSRELAAASRLEEALARYEAHMRPYATSCQAGARHVGGFFAPRTALRLAARDALYGALTSRPLAPLFERLVRSAASDFRLPSYPT